MQLIWDAIILIAVKNAVDFQDRSLRVTHNLAIFGGCGFVLIVITGLFGINVDGILGAKNERHDVGCQLLEMHI